VLYANNCDYGNNIFVYFVDIFCALCTYNFADNLLSSYNVGITDSWTNCVKYGMQNWAPDKYRGTVSFLYVLLM